MAKEKVVLSEREYSGQFAPAVEGFLFNDESKALSQRARHQVTANAQKFGLDLSPHHITAFAQLRSPSRIRSFLDGVITYNDDHSNDDSIETAQSPVMVMESGAAHCWEGAMLAYAACVLNNVPSFWWQYYIGRKDLGHNYIVHKEETLDGEKWGAIAHSAFPNLNGRGAQFFTLLEQANDYVPWYVLEEGSNIRTLKGVSDPFKLGHPTNFKWITATTNLWGEYYSTITADNWFIDLQGGKSYQHPLVTALRREWIAYGSKNAYVNEEALPPVARELWSEFWKQAGDKDLPWTLIGSLAEIEGKFEEEMNMTPVDLQEEVGEVEAMLAQDVDPKDALLTNRHIYHKLI